jgi:uncharacterized OsmC-like protein
MAAPFGYAAFLWLKQNPVALWIGGAIAGLSLYKVYERLRDMRIRKQERVKVIEKIEAKEDKLKDEANEAEDAVTRDLNERSLRDVAARSPENLGPVRRD